jgi:hypothetical protein
MEAPKRHEGRAIADAAATMGADLIVMGQQGKVKAGWHRAPQRHGQCHHHAPSPVLVAR